MGLAMGASMQSTFLPIGAPIGLKGLRASRLSPACRRTPSNIRLVSPRRILVAVGDYKESSAAPTSIPASASDTVSASSRTIIHGLSIGQKLDLEVVDVFCAAVPPTPAQRSTPTAVVIIPGFGADASDYVGLARSLARTLGPESTTVRVAPVRWHTWLQTFGGRPVTPVLEVIDAAVDQALAESSATRVTVVGHSAGGWIARIWLPYVV